ncbi:hypothetical protein KAI87_05350 [Myxococcota bacterium]|nr:hypothetical protein [Myxococcota bacterium]
MASARSLYRLTVLVLLGSLSLSCAQETGGDPPPDKSLYYPVWIEPSPSGDNLYVVNSNFDQRYSSGWLSVINIDDFLAAGMTTDKGDAIVTSLDIPSLGGALSIIPGGKMAVISHRGLPTLTLLEIGSNDSAIDCGSATGSRGSLTRDQEFTDCDEAHLFMMSGEAFDEEDGKDSWVSDPYAMASFKHSLDGSTEETLLAVGHLGTGRLSLYQVSPLGSSPAFTEERSFSLGSSGTGDLMMMPSNSTMGDHTFLAATSQYTGSLTSSMYAIDVDLLRAGEDHVSVTRPISQDIGGAELFGLSFSTDGERAYVSNRGSVWGANNPDAVVVMDTAMLTSMERPESTSDWEPQSAPGFQVLSAQAVPGRPAQTVYIHRALGPDLLAVASFDENALYFFEVRGSELYLVGYLDEYTSDSGEDVGDGPFILRHIQRDNKEILLVLSFYDHTLMALDVTSLDAGDFTPIARLRSEL